MSIVAPASEIALDYRWQGFRQDIQDELGLPDLVATVASAVVFDYQASLEGRIAGKEPA